MAINSSRATSLTASSFVEARTLSSSVAAAASLPMAASERARERRFWTASASAAAGSGVGVGSGAACVETCNSGDGGWLWAWAARDAAAPRDRTRMMPADVRRGDGWRDEFTINNPVNSKASYDARLRPHNNLGAHY